MDTNKQYYNLFSVPIPTTMEAAYSESSDSSAKNNAPITKLTLFGNLLQSNSGGHHHHHQEDDDCYPSDCESVISGEESHPKPDDHNGSVHTTTTTRIHEGDKTFEMIKNKLVSSLSSHGFTAQVEAIDRSEYSSCIMKQVRYRSFSLYSKGMEIKRNGNANVKYAWYGASKHELNAILARGFSLPATPSGLSLSPVDQPLQSMQSATPDENGLSHMLLCRVILGNTEAIRPGSGQYKPSSEELDSGVDNVMCPNKYIVWNGDMNTRILPEFVVSFRCSTCSCNIKGVVRQKVRQPPRVPSSDWMPFVSLIRDLAKFLPHDAVESISKHHSEYKKKKITRAELIHRVRNIAGDKLLISIIRSCRSKYSTGAAAKLQAM